MSSVNMLEVRLIKKNPWFSRELFISFSCQVLRAVLPLVHVSLTLLLCAKEQGTNVNVHEHVSIFMANPRFFFQHYRSSE